MKKLLMISFVLLVIPLSAGAQTADTVPPTTPTNLNPVGVSTSAINLSWSTSTDPSTGSGQASGVAGYKIYRGSAQATTTSQIATSTTNAYQNTGLPPATSYIYAVAAYDVAGNVSIKSPPVSATTQSTSGTGSTGTGGTGTGGTGTGGTGTGGTPTTPPSASEPYQFKRQGIFDCNLIGAQSIGSQTAQGGPYVPVADFTTEQNTGILVYKECVLREVINREREAAMTAFAKKAIVGIQTGRNGSPQYVVDERQELVTQGSDPEFLLFLQDNTLQNLNEALRAGVTRATALNYESGTRAKESILRCPYKGDLKVALTDPTRSFSWEGLDALSDPACNPLGAYYLARNLADSRIAQCQQYLRDQWTWSGGFYAVTDDPKNPCRGKILTPSVNVQASFQAILDSPVRQLESANDIGQMIGALYAGITTQIISDNRGLAGLMQSTGGQPSYLDQVARESAQGLRNAAINVALLTLSKWRQNEAGYFQAVNAIASTLTQTITQLRSAENQCWKLIVPKVCATALSADNTCIETVPCTTDVDGNQTCPIGRTLQVATSTAFSQPIIASQITPLASVALTNVAASQNALQIIERMIQGVTNTASLDAQRITLQQLDSLVAQKALHTEQDLRTVTQQLDNVQSFMTKLVEDTVKAWADDPNPSTGWCNINNPAVVQGWKDRWKK